MSTNKQPQEIDWSKVKPGTMGVMRDDEDPGFGPYFEQA